MAFRVTRLSAPLPPNASIRYRVPDPEEMEAAAESMVDAGLAHDLRTARMVLRNPRSWPDQER